VNPQTVQTTGADGKTTTQTVTDQVIAQGPFASQEAIKEFGTNGGGFSTPIARIHSKIPLHLRIFVSCAADLSRSVQGSPTRWDK
jgi:hypothetical protein